MAQATDYNIANASGATVRADLNSVFSAIVENNSGATEPTTKYANMWWADTTANKLKLRNNANSAWLDIGSLSNNLGHMIGGNNLSDLSNVSLSLQNLGFTATSSELNIMDGVTSTTSEINRLDITTEGAQQASKVVTANSNNKITSFESTGIDDNASSNAISIDSSQNVTFTNQNTAGNPLVPASLGTANEVLTSNGSGSAPTMKSGGRLLQLVEAHDDVSTTISGATFADVGLSVDITPTRTNSKMLVQVSLAWFGGSASFSTKQFGVKILRDTATVYQSASLTEAGVQIGNLSTGINIFGRANWIELDSTANTVGTQVTYKVQVGANTAIDIGANHNRSTIIVMEIA